MVEVFASRSEALGKVLQGLAVWPNERKIGAFPVGAPGAPAGPRSYSSQPNVNPAWSGSVAEPQSSNGVAVGIWRPAVLGTTVDVGDDPADPSDDTAVSPNTSACSACHVSQLAADHMSQNGGDFAALKDADSNLISSGSESCAICHGPGRSADVKEVHGIDGFQFN